ncbi:HpcH/HpaI aldolase/citrate lyase family protein [Oceanicoccus sagamiensis]|uniref:CoA ester lyase n=1 Tax=Oceanicoccus sagamiensis TaxID=716816 RepID=A0A1X9N711_9GAMM|nr:CoA ester lyase [Oceanicoccus sagamiensis]ARN73011.1 CoA ester lyase [Oceanicoccus sagamiensis]
MPVRPRRSVLYMPGSNQRALEKARTLAADTLVLDLEDSVGPEKKVEARDMVVAAVKAGGYGKREIIIRANSLDSEWGEDDVRAIGLSGADGVCLPKIENEAEVEAAIKVLNDVGAPETMQVWVMIETPLGVTNIHQIASSDARMTVIAMGTTDLAKELRVPHRPDRIGLLHSLSQCVLAARAHDKEILDGVYLDLQNDAGFTEVCQQGRDLGFDGKTLIHPKQLAAANDVFGPGADDIERAEKIIAAWKLAEAEGKGVVVVDGKLVEGMHVDEAKRHLLLAEKIAALTEA